MADEILFYCRDCDKVVLNPKKKGDKYEYTCPLCSGDRVAFGTKHAICDFFNIKMLCWRKCLLTLLKNDNLFGFRSGY